MKKLFLSAAVAMSSLAFAQQFGAKAGMNVSSLSKDASLSEQESKIGFNAGVFMNMPIAESFSIQPELMFSQMGDKAVYTNSVDANNQMTRTYTTDLAYITLPVMLQYNVTPALYLEAGPEFGLNVTAKQKYDQTVVLAGTTTTTSGTDDIKDDVNPLNVGVGIGAGYYFTPNIGLTARYVAGFTDVAKDRPSGSDSVKNNVFQVGLAYKF